MHAQRDVLPRFRGGCSGDAAERVEDGIPDARFFSPSATATRWLFMSNASGTSAVASSEEG